jgi:uncharacterized protein YbjQ (UPF0145 family)
LLSAPEFAAVAGAGFDPVGHVFGTAVAYLGFVSVASKCSGSWSYTGRTDIASAAGGPFNALLRKLYGVRRLALSRAVAKCEELGGDGIVGVTLSIRPFPAGGTEFTFAGTAVRARTAIRPAAPFTSHVSGQEFATLLRAGWMPTALVFGIALGSRHDDSRTRSQTRRAQGNREVRGYTALVRDTRRDARDQMEHEVAAKGGTGVVVDEMTLRITERECPTVEGQHDHMAEATFLGTSIVSLGRPARAADGEPLTVMHLNPTGQAPRGLHWFESPAAAPDAMPEGHLLDRYISDRPAARASRDVYAMSDTESLSKKIDTE